MSARPFSTPAAACSESCSIAASSANVASAARAASWSPLASARRKPVGRARERGSLLDGAPEDRVDVGRRRPVHARDLHEAAERDHPDAVLDPVAACA